MWGGGGLHVRACARARVCSECVCMSACVLARARACVCVYVCFGGRGFFPYIFVLPFLFVFTTVMQQQSSVFAC